MHFRAVRAFAFAALCGGALVARGAAADESPKPAGPTPEERAENVLAALPAPSASEPWSFEADVFINGQEVGSARFTLAPVKEGEADLWKTSDGVRYGTLEDPQVTVALEAVMDARLTALHGTSVSTSKGEPESKFSWRRTPMGYGLESQKGDGPAERAMLAEATILKVAVGGLVRFLRAVPAEPATYAVRVLNQDPNSGMTAETRVHDTTIEVQGVKPFAIGGSEREAWVVRATQGSDDERFFAFEPKERRLLAITKPANRLEIRRKGLKVGPQTPTKDTIDWKAPPKTAELAGLQTARAFATADMEALERLFWWPAWLEQVKDEPELKDADEAARKAAVLAAIRKQLSPAPAAVIEESFLAGMRKDVVVTDEPEGRKRVAFPPAFRSLVLIVRESDGVWYVENSEKPKPPAPPAAPESK